MVLTSVPVEVHSTSSGRVILQALGLSACDTNAAISHGEMMAAESSSTEPLIQAVQQNGIAMQNFP